MEHPCKPIGASDIIEIPRLILLRGFIFRSPREPRADRINGPSGRGRDISFDRIRNCARKLRPRCVRGRVFKVAPGRGIIFAGK